MTSEYKPRPVVAVLLSIGCPGLGYAYCGRPLFAVLGFGGLLGILVAAEMLLMGNFATLVVSFAIGALLNLGMIVHAGVMAKGTPPQRKTISNRWYVLLPIAVLVPFVLPPIWRATLFQVARYQMYKTSSSAMQPTILAGDRIVIDRWAFRATGPTRGDLVMFAGPDNLRTIRIERCVGVPGDTISINDKVLFVNGVRAREPFAIHRDPSLVHEGPDTVRDNLPETRLGPGDYFILADDRDASLDSRYFGPVRARFVLGKLALIYWSEDGSQIGKQF